MGYTERKQIIEKIEDLRGSKVITYIVTTRPKIQTMMQTLDLREIYRHLEKISENKPKIDLFIYSFGGEGVVSWALVNLIREFTNKFGILVPYYAFSCATQVAIGADEIIMGKMGTLGPIDPKVANEFNPERGGQFIPISVEDIGGFISLLKDKFEMKNEAFFAKLSERLSSDIRPLALGNAYRQYIKARDDAKKILELHMDPIHDKANIDKIVQTLVEKLYFHSHHVNRHEAKNIGLNVICAEEIKDDKLNLEDLMWKLYLDYETELKMRIPYKDEIPASIPRTSTPPASTLSPIIAPPSIPPILPSIMSPTTSQKIEIPIKFIESTDLSSTFILEQEWVDLGFPQGTKVAIVNNQPGIWLPNPQSPVIPIRFQAQPVEIGGRIYEKREEAFWK